MLGGEFIVAIFLDTTACQPLHVIDISVDYRRWLNGTSMQKFKPIDQVLLVAAVYYNTIGSLWLLCVLLEISGKFQPITKHTF